jgi:hypothetical protein
MCLIAASAQANWFEAWAGGMPSGAKEWTPPNGSIFWTTFESGYRPASGNAAYTNYWCFSDNIRSDKSAEETRDFRLYASKAATAPYLTLPSGNVVAVATNITSGGFRSPAHQSAGYYAGQAVSPIAPFSIAFWVYDRRLSATPRYYQRTAGFFPTVWRNASKLALYAPSTTYYSADNYDIPSNTWTHIALTCSNVGTSFWWRVYANATLKISATNAATLSTNDMFDVGQDFTEANAMNGYFDDFIIASNALDQAQISEIVTHGDPTTRAK